MRIIWHNRSASSWIVSVNDSVIFTPDKTKYDRIATIVGEAWFWDTMCGRFGSLVVFFMWQLSPVASEQHSFDMFELYCYHLLIS